MQQRTKKEIKYVVSEAKRHLEEKLIISEEHAEGVLALVKEMADFFSNAVSTEKEQREKDYAEGVKLNTKYIEYIEGINFNMILSEDLYLFLKDFIMCKAEYDRETNIHALDVYKEFFILDKATAPNKVDIDDSVKTELVNGKKFYTFNVAVGTLFKISFITSLFKNKGINDKSFKMRQLTQIITDISNLIEYFNIQGDELYNKFENWRNGFVKYDEEEDNNTNSVEQADVEKVD